MYTKIEYSGLLEVLDLKEEDMIAMGETTSIGKRNWHNFSKYARNNAHKSYKWWGTNDLNEYLGYVENGWEKGAKIIEDVEKDLPDLPILKDMRPTLVRRDYGDVLDMQSVYMGDLDNAWEGLHRGVRRADLRYSIYVDIVYSHVNHGAKIYNSVALGIAWAKRLISAGQTVRIIALAHINSLSGEYDEVTDILIPVKNWGDTLVPDSLAILMLGGGLRYLGFKAMSCYPKVVTGSYGVVDFSQNYNHLKATLPPNEKHIILPGLISDSELPYHSKKILDTIREDVAWDG